MSERTREIDLPLGVLPEKYQRILEDNWFSYALFLPTLLFMVLLLWFPFIRGIWMSFHQWPFIGEPEWIGLGNYEFLFTWEVFYTSLKATVLYSTATLIQLGLAIVLALVVANIDEFKNLIGGIYLVPYTMPPVVTGTLWLYLLEPTSGPISKYLRNINVLEQPIYWSTNGDTALAVVTLVTAWTFWPFMFLIILASREKIPDAHYESARVYGANRSQMFWRVTLPQIKSAILVALSIRLIWNLSKISQPLQLTRGGPGYETSVLAILLYRFAYMDGKLGVGYAVGIVLLVITLLFVALFIREFERERGGGTR